MHIDKLIAAIVMHLPFQSVEAAQAFLSELAPNDQVALISALYFGRSHLGSDCVNEDTWPYLQSGQMNRLWEQDSILPADFATILYEKGSNLAGYYDAFLRATEGSGYDRSRY
ncbi:hypothetical protein IAE35_01955 [Pseudomonas sp. S75]|uniref:hypothetical protein n=1 Tax=unclassified Pseudomonas TaxID=196821 RepID=UPI00190393AA|nr:MULTISPECIES: hypothetical protein [unclassified Pseudomonas]MBJ9973980.1 hypothetical protein [Pseudomonas sp. S30]MBK0152090.1 hypothetical protein [Pseudomonas sp. S75]